MFFNFTFRHYLTNPRNLADELQKSSMRGFGKRVLFVFLAGILLFGFRSLWGMNTESLTSLLTMTTADYTLARFASLFGSLIWSVVYISFHLFGFAYILSALIGIPFKKLLPMQLLMTSLLLVEKAIVFLVFAIKGASASVSFLSFGPLAATFLEIPFFIFLLNQLTITTMLIIAYQYKFLQRYSAITKSKRLIWSLIGLHLLMAIITASIGLLPAESLFEFITGGGVENE